MQIKERRLIARAPAVLAPHGYRVEQVDLEALAGKRAEWRRLAQQAIEPNLFFEPDFLLAHARRAPAPDCLIVRREVAGRFQLVGFCPLHAPGLIARADLLRVYDSPFTAHGAPLLDRDHYKGAFDALLFYIARRHPQAAGLSIPAVRLEGDFGRMLERRAQRLGADFRLLERRGRACLTPDHRVAAGKSRRNLERIRRRLAERGLLRFSIAAPDEARAAMDAFLRLESEGWKGAGGTALASQTADLQFARALAKEGKLGFAQIAQLTLDDELLAAGVVLRSGREAAFWKIAYQEAAARYSPGVLLTQSLTEHLLADRSLTFVDSCAGPDHPMMDRLWPQQAVIADVLIDIEAYRRLRFRAAARREALRLALRRGVKVWYKRLFSGGA